MSKQNWIDKAVEYMVSITGEWENEENLTDYCESLYETYAEDNQNLGETFYSPEDAVDEDMTYWE